MRFPVTHRLPIGGANAAPSPVRRPYGPVESDCAACEWFQPSVFRCAHPRNGCPRGEHRREPWLRAVVCPVIRDR